MKLSEAPEGEYTVVWVLWGRESPKAAGKARIFGQRDKVSGSRPGSSRGERNRQRLRVLGIYPGAAITLAGIAAGEVRVLEVRGMRLALGRQIAARITVTPR